MKMQSSYSAQHVRGFEQARRPAAWLALAAVLAVSVAVCCGLFAQAQPAVADDEVGAEVAGVSGAGSADGAADADGLTFGEIGLVSVCEQVGLRIQSALPNRTGAVASVLHEGDTVYHDSLASALEGAAAGDTVTLLRSASENVLVDKAVTLDLGGFTLTGNRSQAALSGFDAYVVTVAVTAEGVTIKNGTVASPSAGAGQANSYGVIASGAVLTLDDMTVDSSDIGVFAIGTSSVTIGSAESIGARTVEVKTPVSQSGYTAVVAGDGATVTINGGLFSTNVDTSRGSFVFPAGYSRLTQIDASDATDGGKWCLATDLTVTFANADGAVLSERQYALNTLVASIEQPTVPAKPDSDGYKYFFSGWSPALAPVTSDVTYTAQYAAKRDLAFATAAFAGATYTGGELKPKLSLTFDYGQTVVPATAYDVVYSDNVNAGVNTGTAVITSKVDDPSYAGTLTAHFTIDKQATTATASPTGLTLAHGEKGTITISGDNVGEITRLAGAIEAIASVSYLGDVITVTPVAGGSFTLVVSAKSTGNNYADPEDVVVDITVSKIVITDPMVSDPGSQLYTGQQIKPAVTVMYNGAPVDPEGNYTVEYGENVQAGTAGTVTVTGIGNDFTGTVTKTFAIVEGGPDDSGEWDATPYATTDGQRVPATVSSGDGGVTLTLPYDGLAHGVGVETPVEGAQVAFDPENPSLLNPGTLPVTYTLTDPSGELDPQTGAVSLVVEPVKSLEAATPAGTLRVEGDDAFAALSRDGNVLELVVSLLSDESADAAASVRAGELKAAYLTSGMDQDAFWAFDVSLVRRAARASAADGEELHGDFGTMAVQLPLGTGYAGRSARVVELHKVRDDAGAVTGEEEIVLGDSLTVDKLGHVTVTVDRLSEFVVTLNDPNAADGGAAGGDAAGGDAAAAGNGSNASNSGSGSSANKAASTTRGTSASTASAKTGDLLGSGVVAPLLLFGVLLPAIVILCLAMRELHRLRRYR